MAHSELEKMETLSKQLLVAHSGILSLTISDSNGNTLATSFTSEYERNFLDSAKSLRSRAGLFSATMLGMEEEVGKIFGPTEAVVRIHENGKLIIIPFPSKKGLITFLTKREVVADEILSATEPFVREM
jgi:hypothetical protein